MRILILAKDLDQAKFVQKGFCYENLSAEIFKVEDERKVPLKYFSSDAFLLLFKNPNKALCLIKKISQSKKTSPIVLLTYFINEDLEFKLRRAGCDLIFTRPYSFSDIALQLKYLLYVSRDDEKNRFLKSGSLKLDVQKRVLFRGEKMISLRNKEFALLEFLMINQGRVLSRNEIFENLWDRNADISTNTVDVHVSGLRKKIDIDLKNSFIKTINCIGYLFATDQKDPQNKNYK